ncbi:MAG: hypothetical protein Q8M26_00525 [Pseudolabrys sp.]|nr:hypothetical protein [Pseudolabrys sp.]
MSLSSWYHHKAEQCTRLATGTVDPLKRTLYLSEQKSWLALVAPIDLEAGGKEPD